MGLSKLASKCQICPYVSFCKNKQMEELGYLPLPQQQIKISDTDIEMFRDILLDTVSKATQIPRYMLEGSE